MGVLKCVKGFWRQSSFFMSKARVKGFIVNGLDTTVRLADSRVSVHTIFREKMPTARQVANAAAKPSEKEAATPSEESDGEAVEPVVEPVEEPVPEGEPAVAETDEDSAHLKIAERVAAYQAKVELKAEKTHTKFLLGYLDHAAVNCEMMTSAPPTKTSERHTSSTPWGSSATSCRTRTTPRRRRRRRSRTTPTPRPASRR